MIIKKEISLNVVDVGTDNDGKQYVVLKGQGVPDVRMYTGDKFNLTYTLDIITDGLNTPGLRTIDRLVTGLKLKGWELVS